MNFQHLQYVVEINNCGSISKAAAKLYITQPHLSKILQEMENEFNITIYERTKSGVELTEDGREFVDYALKILRDIDRLGEIYATKNSDLIKVKIASMPISHVMDTCVTLANLHSHEHLNFIYKEQYFYDVVKDIYSGEAELGVLVVSGNIRNMASRLLANKGIAYTNVCSSPIYALMRPNHPLTYTNKTISIEDVYNYGVVITDVLKGFSLDGHSSSIINSVIDIDKVNNLIAVNSRAALHGFLAATDYISFGTKSIKDQDAAIGLISLPLSLSEQGDGDYSSHIWIIHLENRKLSPIAEEFIEIFTTTYGNLFK